MPDRVPAPEPIQEPLDINSGRRCRRCTHRLVKHEVPGPVTSWTWQGSGLTDTTTLPNGMVIWACPLCDLKGTT